MALMSKSCVRTASSRPQKRSVTVVCQAGAVERLQAGAAAAAIAFAISSCPAEAGVVFVKPERKKLFQDDGSVPAAVVSTSAAAPAAAPAVKAAPKPKAEESAFKSGDLDPRTVALPGAIALVGGGLAAAYKLDGGFADFFAQAMVRDSNNFAGYEPELKPEGGYQGTRKVKATGKKGGFSFGPFGKK